MKKMYTIENVSCPITNLDIFGENKALAETFVPKKMDFILEENDYTKLILFACKKDQQILLL